MRLFVGVKAVIVRDDGKVLIIREGNGYNEGTNLGRWDVVGGRIEPEESLFEGLKREVKEESGLDIEVGKILHVADNFPVIKGEKVHIVRTYYACTATDSLAVTISEDHDSYEWIDLHDYKEFDVMEEVVEAFNKYLETK